MKSFDYIRASSIKEATDLKGQYIGGGTNLIDLMKHEIMQPDQLVDVSRLSLDRISSAGKGVRIGANLRNSDLAADLQIRENYPLLSRAILAGASGQIRNMATTAGNLLQRTRCPYFYDTATQCNKRDPNSGCDARDGVNRMTAILGVSPSCIAAHPSDMAVALMALDALVEVESDSGSRQIALADFYRLPGDTPQHETMLEPGDLITAVLLPAPVGGRQIYRKIRDRASYAFALVSIAAVIKMEGDQISEAALAFGGLAPKPWRNPNIEAVLRGAPPSAQLFDAAADQLLAEAQLLPGNAFKKDLARRSLAAVLSQACGLEDHP